MFILRNKTDADIEINDLGITVPALQDYRYEYDINCPEVDALIENGNIVFVTEDGRELTQEDTTRVYREVSTPIYDSFYTKEQVDQKIADLIGTASSTLDTLNELAQALGNDPNFATTITNELANKAPLDHTHNYAPLNHNHDGLYHTKTQLQTLLALKSDISHNHDRNYAQLNHNHDSIYANITHNHDGVYIRPENLPVFGQEFATASSRTVSTHATASDYNKLVLNVSVKSSGLFRLGWTYQWNHDSTTTDFIAKIRHNGAEIYTHQQEPKDSGGKYGNTGTDQKYIASSFLYLNLTKNTEHEFILYWSSNKAGKRSSVWNAAFEFWRVQ